MSGAEHESALVAIFGIAMMFSNTLVSPYLAGPSKHTSPNLPAWKQDVIDAMGFGVVNKCIMTWNNDEDYVWPNDELWFILVTPEDETSGQWTTFFNPSEFKGIPTLTGESLVHFIFVFSTLLDFHQHLLTPNFKSHDSVDWR